MNLNLTTAAFETIDYIAAEIQIFGQVTFETRDNVTQALVTVTGEQLIETITKADRFGVQVRETTDTAGRVAFEIHRDGSVYGRYTQA